MDTQELKTIMASLYGFTATQLVQQVSAINALERTLEDIKKGASWQSLDLCLDSAISTLENIKNAPGINSERSENTPLLNIDRFRTMTAKELACTLAHRYFVSNTADVYDWLMTEYTGFDRKCFERSETRKDTNVDYIRSLSVSMLASKIKDLIRVIEEEDCDACPFYGSAHVCSYEGIVEWLISERSEKEDADE